MDHSVAPYMIAIAAGDLAFKPLGPRTGVWTEPAMLDAAAAELSDTEKMVSAAEKLYGPYQWGRYDVLVLPPSFPIGGMENPNLTFLTPTFIAGDKSLVSLVAHELAHSWSGNLATNATWDDFWLNEGMTTYAQSRIIEELYGPKVGRAADFARRRRPQQGDRRKWRPDRPRHAASPRRQRAAARTTCRATSPMKKARPSCAPSRRRSAATASTPI